jgi:hypothetical protein
VPVDVCGTSVPDVWDVLDVVDVVDVVDVLEVDGLLEQAASASAHAGRIERRTDHTRNVRGMRRV